MIVPLADTFALIFYDRFFHLEPEVRELFHIDMGLQREKLMTMITFIIRELDDPAQFTPDLKEMGRRHASYRVKAEHYPILTDAFILALEVTLGEKVTDEMRQAWKKAMILVSEIMLAGAAGSPRGK